MSFMLLGILNSQASGGGLVQAYDLLESTTLSTSASGVTFDSLGSYSDYKSFQIRWVARTDRAGTDGPIGLNVNGVFGGGAGTYAQHGLQANGSTVTSFAVIDPYYSTVGNVPGSTQDANVYGAGVIDVSDWASTTKKKTFRSVGGFAGSSKFVSLYSLLRNSTDAVTSIEVFAGGNNFIAGSRFSLIGIK